MLYFHNGNLLFYIHYILYQKSLSIVFEQNTQKAKHIKSGGSRRFFIVVLQRLSSQYRYREQECHVQDGKTLRLRTNHPPHRLYYKPAKGI